MPEKKYMCYMCGYEKEKRYFYSAWESFIKVGLIPYCKNCLKTNCYLENGDGDSDFDFKQFLKMLKLINRPFLPDLWDSTVKQVESGKIGAKTKKQSYADDAEVGDNKDYFGIYMKNIQLPQFKDLGWGDSLDGGIPKVTVIGSMDKPDNRLGDFEVTEEITDRWGQGFEPDVLQRFEKKYEEISRSGIEKSALHSEFLLQYIRYAVKSEIATAKDDPRAAKEWGNLAKDAAASAKIKPMQLRPEDFSDGLDSVGQIVRAVEQQSDIVSVLPKFKGSPQDQVDFTVLQFVNYIRLLKGLRECEYPDLYKFTDEIAKEYKDLADKYANDVERPPDESLEGDGDLFEDIALDDKNYAFDNATDMDTDWGDTDD